MTTQLRFEATRSSGDVSALLDLPEGACALAVLGHGEGAGMRHTFMESIVGKLVDRGIGSFRYQFPYMEAGGKRPSPQPILLKTIRSAVTAATEAAPDLPLIAGGKSMGGRMTSLAAAESALPGARGLVFLGFPLHAVGKPSSDRGDHLDRVDVPMLFLQGTRDRLADLDLLRPVCARLGKIATLHVVDGADHSFKMLKSSGRTQDDVLDELADVISDWTEPLF